VLPVEPLIVEEMCGHAETQVAHTMHLSSP